MLVDRKSNQAGRFSVLIIQKNGKKQKIEKIEKIEDAADEAAEETAKETDGKMREKAQETGGDGNGA